MPETAEQPQVTVQPGQLAPWDYSKEQPVKLSEDARNALKTLCENAAKKDSAARRFEVEQAWEAQLFHRGYQFILRRKGGGWELPQERKKKDFDGLPTNIYSANGQIIISALTRGIPKVRFSPDDPNSDIDITTADEAEKYKKAFTLNNDLTELHTDVSEYFWTDGRVHTYTRHVLDGQRFGYEDDQPGVVPETEGQDAASETQQGLPDSGVSGGQIGATPDDGGGAPESGASSESSAGMGDALESTQPNTSTTRKPLGREITNAYGKLQVKVPMNVKHQSEYHFLQFSLEYDLAYTKALFPDIADEIEAASGPGENELDRIARINVALALSANYTTGDTFGQDVTVQRTWFRPSAFMSQERTVRNELLAAFPKGCLVVFAGKTFAFARPECMDDHWATARASRGAGQNCASLGAWLIPVQKRVNNLIDLLYDFFTRTIPNRYADSEAFNLEALQNTPQTPGEWTKFTRQPGVPFNELMGTDPPVTHQPELPEFIKFAINELSQLLSGAYPALSGGDTEGNDTASGINMQRDQALGRLGIAWHAMQSMTAEYHRQAVGCAAACRDSDISESVPDSDALTINLNDLKGNVRCYPEADSAFPETYGERQARFTAFVQSAEKNPLSQQLLTLPKNMKVAKDAIGLTDFDIPQTDAENKQLGEFEILLKSGPMPNPQFVQMEQLAQQGPQQGAPPEAMQMLQQAMQNIPQMLSTVPIDEICDDHETEAQTCLSFINSPKGRKLKNGNEKDKAGFANIRQHFQEHKKLADAAKQQAMQQMQKSKVSESINFKDLPADGQMEMAQQAGITLSPAAIMQKQQADKPAPPAGPIQ